MFQIGQLWHRRATQPAPKFTGMERKPIFEGFKTCFPCVCVRTMDHFVNLVRPVNFLRNGFKWIK